MLSKFDFYRCPIDKWWYKQTINNVTTYVIVYVDDLFIVGKIKTVINLQAN